MNPTAPSPSNAPSRQHPSHRRKHLSHPRQPQNYWTDIPVPIIGPIYRYQRQLRVQPPNNNQPTTILLSTRAASKTCRVHSLPIRLNLPLSRAVSPRLSRLLDQVHHQVQVNRLSQSANQSNFGSTIVSVSSQTPRSHSIHHPYQVHSLTPVEVPISPPENFRIEPNTTINQTRNI